MRPSSSSRAADCRACEVALGNCLRSNGARRRITHKPHAKDCSWLVIAARIWRLSAVRVTDRRACRLGTTAPSQRLAGGASSGGALGATSGKSSTDRSAEATPAVDNSGAGALFCRQAGWLGSSPRWCAAKCALRKREGVFSTRSKSADRWSRSTTVQRRPARQQRAAGENSDRQALAPLGAASIDDGAATPRLHADKEPVRACTADFGGLVGAFHDLYPVLLRLILSWPRPGTATLLKMCVEPGFRETEYYTKNPLLSQ